MKVKFTTNYSQFNLSALNRTVRKDSTAYKKLKENIQNRGKIIQPSIVSADSMIVLDGQHRLAIAQELKMPYPYIVHDDLSVDDCLTVNSDTNVWKVQDYLTFGVKSGNPHYLRFLDTMSEFNVSASLLMVVLTNNESTRALKDKTLRYTEADADRVRPMLKRLDKIRRIQGGRFNVVLKKVRTVKALLALMSQSGYRQGRFLEGLKQVDHIPSFNRSEDALSFFEEILYEAA